MKIFRLSRPFGVLSKHRRLVELAGVGHNTAKMFSSAEAVAALAP